MQQLTEKNNELQTALGNSEGEREAARGRADTAAKGLREAETQLKQLSEAVAGRGEELRETTKALDTLRVEVEGREAEVAARQAEM